MKWFTADPHFHHESVLKMCNRPFASITEHDDHLIEQYNRYVRPHDSLYVLGDVGWADPGNVLRKISCKDKHLIWGNHDKGGFAKYFRSEQDTLVVKTNTLAGSPPSGMSDEERRNLVQEFVGKRDIKSQHIFLSHYAHAFWPGSHNGWYHLYGHNHSQREEYLDNLWPGRRSMDCGVDNAKRLLGEYRPFSEDEVLAILGSRPGHDDVEFYINQQRGPVV